MISGMLLRPHLIEPILKSDFENSIFLDSFGQFWIVLDSFESEKSNSLGSSIFFFDMIRGAADNGDNTVW